MGCLDPVRVISFKFHFRKSLIVYFSYIIKTLFSGSVTEKLGGPHDAKHLVGKITSKGKMIAIPEKELYSSCASLGIVVKL